MVAAGTSSHAHNGTNGHTNGNGASSSHGYRVQEHPIGQRRKLRVVFIGAGASGLTWHEMAKDLDWLDYQIYEKNPEIGGTWYENRYPNAGCDVPSYSYQFLFHTNPRWSQFYAKQPEILAYLQQTAEQLDFHAKVKLDHRVSGCLWDEEEGKWHVEITTASGEVIHDECDLLVNGGGVLNNWKWPDIEGLHEFEGTLLHSANWDSSVNCTGKRVAVIGSGSSGIQIVPAMAEIASHVTAFNRSKSWIMPGICSEMTPDKQGANYKLTSEEIDRLVADPAYLMQQRKYVEHALQAMFKPLMKDTPEQLEAQKMATELMRTQCNGDEELLAKLLPDYHVGCKRPTPGEGYIRAFTLDHVDLSTSPIIRFTKEGILTADGKEHKVDIIACATGFDVSFAPRYPVQGRGKATLAEKWTKAPRAYLGLAENGFPNMFHIYGPYSPVAHGSFFPGLDMYCRYVLRIADKMSRDKIKSIEVKEKAVADFVKHTDAWLPRAAWTSSCTNWYKTTKRSKDGKTVKDEDGKVIMHAGTMPHALHVFKETRFEHFDIDYLETDGVDGNCMAWMANGWTEEELKPNGHLTGFLDPYIEAALKKQAPKVVDVEPDVGTPLIGPLG